MIFTGTGKISQALNKLQQQVDGLRPVHTPGLLTNHTTRGVSRKPVSNGDSIFPVLCRILGLVNRWVIAAPFQTGFTPDVAGAGGQDLGGVSLGNPIAVEPPPEFHANQTRTLETIRLPESFMSEGNRSEHLVQVLRVIYPSDQLRVIEFPDSLNDGKRERTLTQIWWPTYAPGEDIWAMPARNPHLQQSFGVDPNVNSQFFWEGKPVIHGYFDLNVAARRWTNHRDVVDDARAFEKGFFDPETDEVTKDPVKGHVVDHVPQSFADLHDEDPDPPEPEPEPEPEE